LENFAHTVAEVAKDSQLEHVVVTSMGDLLGLKGYLVNFVVRYVKKLVKPFSLPGHTTFKAALAAGDRRQLEPVDVDVNDIAFLQYTGGTTGVSKGASLTNSNILSNVSQNSFWVDVAYRKKGRPENLTYVCALPLYHIFALTVNSLMGMEQGGHNILIPDPRNLKDFVGAMANHEIHVFPGLNTLFISLMNYEPFSKLDMSSLVLTLGGGMAVQRSVAEEWKEMTGCIIAEGYGLSETSPVATANRFDATEFSGTIGLPLPSTDIAIRDDDGNDMPVGEVGEICIRGPQVMAGYWKRPDATAIVMSDDGFFKSGDMGFMNESGRTKIVDRKKDMILVSGFNVYPNEIEEVAAEHPGILEAAAVGVPDDYSGEVVKLFVVKKDPNLTRDDVKAHCKKSMTGYKRPKFIEFIDELPKSNVGKVLRRELRGK
ncbi:MAG TPA: long-chain fatty acid--CoA ligase, partial [Rhizobiales bacterium]|nr:long-chain fatty acid--CoA ligase [Hyphomicrobiales bacterium]